MHERVTDADVVVVGAGPGGATTAAYLARAGRSVLLIDKERFPRDKVCGDGLTPRVIRELQLLGLEGEAQGRTAGFTRNEGLRIHGGHTVMELPWPELHDWPNWGGASARMVFDETIARQAVKDGATLWEAVTVTGLRWKNPRTEDRVAGVTWRDEEGQVGEVRAPIVIAADGASSKLGIAAGLHRRTDRPMAVAARGYWESDRGDDAYMSSFLDLKDAQGTLLSGYGWIFPLDGGTINVGLGLLNTSKGFRQTNYRDMLTAWSTGLADEFGTTPDRQVGGRIRTSPIPMGFNRTPIHHKGLLLVGDSGGMVNPFNGEGISYAMEAGRLAADVIDRAFETRQTATLDLYDRELRRRIGGYYTLGSWFSHVVGNPTMMKICTEYGMPHRPLMELVLKMMAHLTDAKPSDGKDVLLNMLQRLAPAA